MPDTKDGLDITVKGDCTVKHQAQTSILESLEQHNVEMHYHCREGFCGACRCKLVEGQVDYLVDPLAYIDDDEILACCSVPLTPITIIIE